MSVGVKFLWSYFEVNVKIYRVVFKKQLFQRLLDYFVLVGNKVTNKNFEWILMSLCSIVKFVGL